MKNLVPLLFLTVLAGFLSLKAVYAQNSEEASVKATIDRLFEGMKRGDSAVVRGVFHPTARLQSVANRQGTPVLVTESIDGFVKAVGTPRKDVVLDERLKSYDIKIDGDMATVWTPYEFYLGDKYSHEGVNAFQLFRSPEGWKIIQICDTRRRKK